MKKTTSQSRISLAMMDMLILGPFDTLKQGPRSRLMGVEDLWVRGEDKNKA